MLSKSQIRLITSLQYKKFRKQHGLFVVEGAKSVAEFIQSDYQVQQLFATAGSFAKMDKIPQNIKFVEISEAELKKISNLQTPQGVLATVSIPVTEEGGKNVVIDPNSLAGDFTLVLDDVQDPGNLGTIIRTADWFGISRIICSPGSVDVYNPKAVQASMGSLSRMRVIYADLPVLIFKTQLPVFGAMLEGTSIYRTKFGREGLIILGNEGNGISPEVADLIQHPVTIPRIGRAESLNVAISAAIFCSEVKRPSS